MARTKHVPTLLKLFRRYGFEGVSLTKISKETGLGKASLYHHFPGGKAEMAEAALEDAGLWLGANVLEPLAEAVVPVKDGEVSPVEVFEGMAESTNLFFNQGKDSCILAVLGMEEASNLLFRGPIRSTFSAWIEAIAVVLIAAGVDDAQANVRGQDAMIAIEGALILSQSLQDYSVFQRVIKQLPQQLCQDL